MQRKYTGKISKIIAAVVLVSSLVVSTTVVNATTVNDLGKSSAYSREAIKWMADNNIISGDKQGNFNPVKTISRAELVTLLVKALGIDTSNLPAKATFTDVPTGHWAYKYVEAANKAGIVSGIGNGKFGVNNLSTREQITTMILNHLSISREAVLANQGLNDIQKFKDESEISDWAKSSIQFAVSNKLMSGISSDMFSPKGSATKEQIAVILYKFLNSSDILQNAATLKRPHMTFNGDILKLTVSPEIENAEVLVPLEFFKKIGVDVTTDEQMNNV
ncbi:MAG: S-layer homology domain-containing protein, partial [Ruminiclostridium sp.]